MKAIPGQNHEGFTLLEVATSLMILAILAAMLVVQFTKHVAMSRKAIPIAIGGRVRDAIRTLRGVRVFVAVKLQAPGRDPGSMDSRDGQITFCLESPSRSPANRIHLTRRGPRTGQQMHGAPLQEA